MTAVQDLSIEDLERLIEKVVQRTIQDYLEDREGLASSRYVASVERARSEYAAGETTPLCDFHGS